jgi:threonine synthase
LWAFEEFLPVDRHVSLGEGFVPLVESTAWNAAFTLEYVSPSGSFKDRGASVLVSRAAELGVERILDDSSGNAGAAIAQYAAAAGISAEIFVPAEVKPGKIKMIERCGAKPVRVSGSREDVTEACVERVEAGEGWYGSHAWNPAFFAGTMTFAFEVCAQRNWTVPDAIVIPVGHGTLFLGAYRGFSALSECGWIDELPTLFGVQASGYAPVASTYHAASNNRNELADGIQIMNPARETQIHQAVEDTGGDVITVTEAEVSQALDRLHAGGFYVEPTSAAGPAGLEKYREHEYISSDMDVVVPLTGSGLKL